MTVPGSLVAARGGRPAPRAVCLALVLGFRCVQGPGGRARPVLRALSREFSDVPGICHGRHAGDSFRRLGQACESGGECRCFMWVLGYKDTSSFQQRPPSARWLGVCKHAHVGHVGPSRGVVVGAWVCVWPWPLGSLRGFHLFPWRREGLNIPGLSSGPWWAVTFHAGTHTPILC